MSSATPLSEQPPLLRLVDAVLEEQSALTAVERFSLDHDAASGPALAPVYESLLPARSPQPGEQYAFRVDLGACTGCKACVTACHSLNGLDEGETWRHVGLLVTEDPEDAAQQTVTGACHHCADPGCMKGCPVQAYEKDETTGIVRHLDDQCIGCKYCTLTCPYDVPQYNDRMGIVRKCDMCSGRLEQGEAPACVQGCPNGAISIELVPVVAGGTAPNELLPVAPLSLANANTTRPTTRYSHEAPELRSARWQPADREAISPAAAHWPLALLLVCTQLSVGLLTVALGLFVLDPEGTPLATASIAALVFAGLGQAAAIAHLGRPQYAFRAVLGWKTSWMSREILALGGYLSLLAVAVGAHLVLQFELPGAGFVSGALSALLFIAACVAGWVGIFTSVMIYVATARPAWRFARTGIRFFGSALVLGGLAAAALGAVVSPGGGGATLLIVSGGVALLTGIGLYQERVLRERDARSADAALVRRARIELERFPDRVRGRTAAGVVALVALALAVLSSGNVMAGLFAVAAVGAGLVSVLAERNLFFVAEASRGMPGA